MYLTLVIRVYIQVILVYCDRNRILSNSRPIVLSFIACDRGLLTVPCTSSMYIAECVVFKCSHLLFGKGGGYVINDTTGTVCIQKAYSMQCVSCNFLSSVRFFERCASKSDTVKADSDHREFVLAPGRTLASSYTGVLVVNLVTRRDVARVHSDTTELTCKQ